MTKRLFIVSILLFWSCEEIVVQQDNPLDLGNPEYEEPQILGFTINGVDKMEVVGPTLNYTILGVNYPTLTFEWTGNELMRYRWKFNDEDWLERENDTSIQWLDQTSVTWDDIDDGTNLFYLQGLYTNDDESEILIAQFSYLLNNGTALSFYPRVQRVSCQSESPCGAIGDTVQFHIRTNPDVKNYVNPRDSSLTAAQYTISFDPDAIEIISVAQGSVFQKYGDESIFSIDYDNSNGTLSIITARLGNYPLDESGIFSTINFLIKSSGTSELNFDGTEVFRDNQGYDIPILFIQNGTLIVE